MTFVSVRNHNFWALKYWKWKSRNKILDFVTNGICLWFAEKVYISSRWNFWTARYKQILRWGWSSWVEVCMRLLKRCNCCYSCCYLHTNISPAASWHIYIHRCWPHVRWINFQFDRCSNLKDGWCALKSANDWSATWSWWHLLGQQQRNKSLRNQFLYPTYGPRKSSPSGEQLEAESCQLAF